MTFEFCRCCEDKDGLLCKRSEYTFLFGCAMLVIRYRKSCCAAFRGVGLKGSRKMLRTLDQKGPPSTISWHLSRLGVLVTWGFRLGKDLIGDWGINASKESDCWQMSTDVYNTADEKNVLIIGKNQSCLVSGWPDFRQKRRGQEVLHVCIQTWESMRKGCVE